MKPSLFRTTWAFLGETFPLLPRIRRSFWGLLLFSILLIISQFPGSDNLHVRIKPVEFGAFSNKTITTYVTGTVQLNGELILSHPTIWQRVMFTNAKTNLDIISLLFIAVISIIIIRITPKVFQSNLFRKDISRSIQLIGYLMILHAIVSIYRTMGYAPAEINRITHNEFTSFITFPILIWAEAYTALIVIAIGSAYKRGIQLQQEQDLTV